MRIGELLHARGVVESTTLDRALAEQRHMGMRLCSLLVARGLIDADAAARALGAQHEVAAALQRHLASRDPRLARLIPPELGRSLCALPIGRSRNGELIVCVRDPHPRLVTALGTAAQTAIVLAVAPATQLERLVAQTYGTSPQEDEFEVDLSTGPIAILPETARAPASVQRAVDPLDLSTFTLVGLDDARVSKDPTQSGQFALPRTLTPLPPPRPQPLFAEGTSPPSAKITLPPPIDTAVPVPPLSRLLELDDTLVKLQRATTRDLATDIAMEFAIGRWSSSLLLMIKEGVALGHRGHGAQLSEDTILAVTVPLATPSIIRAAHDARRMVTELPANGGAIQDRLTRLLGQPARQAAAPIVIGQRIACVLVVGDARDAANATPELTLDLDDLTVALGSAYARIMHET